jgi:sugar lactone lactonase YvrE
MSEQFKVVHEQPMLVGECPLWHPAERNIYWVDIADYKVHRIHPLTGEHRSWLMDSEPAALAMHPHGGLLVATRAGFVHLDTANGSITLVAAAPYDTAVARFNDGCVDPAGRFWVGTIYEPRDKPAAEMYCLERGVVSLKWSGGMTNSNGLAFSAEHSAMYHADTTSHRIDRYHFDAETGALAHPQTFHQFSADKTGNYGGRPDGAAVDSEGAYWCAMFEGARLLRFSPQGELLREIKLPLRCPTMVAFGGDDLRTLYITSASHGRSSDERAQYPLTGCVLSLQVDVAGREEPMYLP